MFCRSCAFLILVSDNFDGIVQCYRLTFSRACVGGTTSSQKQFIAMDKPIYISGGLFALSEIFAVASLVHVDWIHSADKEDLFVLGLTSQCQSIYGRERTCFSPTLPTEWEAALFFLVVGIAVLAAALGFVFSSKWRRSTLIYAKWSAFAAIAFFCAVGMLFPIGFRQPIVGGEAYKLPSSWSLGPSYNYLWIFSVVLSCLGLGVLLMPLRLWIVNR